MVIIMLGALSGLILLLELSVYTALILAKKTDDLIISNKLNDDSVFTVSFPGSIIKAS